VKAPNLRVLQPVIRRPLSNPKLDDRNDPPCVPIGRQGEDFHYLGEVVVIANGKRVDIPDGSTVADLLQSLGLAGRALVVERNGEPVDRGEVAATRLLAGDRCEVVRAVAGG